MVKLSGRAAPQNPRHQKFRACSSLYLTVCLTSTQNKPPVISVRLAWISKIFVEPRHFFVSARLLAQIVKLGNTLIGPDLRFHLYLVPLFAFLLPNQQHCLSSTKF